MGYNKDKSENPVLGGFFCVSDSHHIIERRKYPREIFLNYWEHGMMEAATEGGTPMTRTEHYASGVLFFFDGKPMELSLYQTLFERMEAVFSAASVKAQKSQISFYNKHLFAAASLPVRRRKD